ncbi:5-deoxy-glucuronate isomerase (plasmid) [Asticcacaulis sp. MM231]|uniref:5-deoxy-glucuronate isomerase n=1 Tax=Asticcacaulis sp. MM231 TaxID=3157666 RepID=UPI0032D588A4
MSHLKVKSAPCDEFGVVIDITPESAGWKHVGFRMVKLLAGQTYRGREASREACLVVLSGDAHITVRETDFGRVGGRKTVFEDVAPGAVYVPPDEPYRVVAESAVELAVCTAPGSAGFSARTISQDEMVRQVRGTGTNTRYVRNILPEDQPAFSLLVVEVVTPGGHWSSYPPHKHDSARPGDETALEETYYHRINPRQGFACQRVYTDDRRLDEMILVEDEDVVMVPEGYHPVSAAHGYDLYYLNVMAGPTRAWLFHNDRDHAWMLSDSAQSAVR